MHNFCYQRNKLLDDHNDIVLKILLYFYDQYNQKNKCVDWEIFGGYQQFRDFYYNSYEQSHFKQCYYQIKNQQRIYQSFLCDNCKDNVGGIQYHTCYTYNDEIYDLQQPEIYIIWQYNKNEQYTDYSTDDEPDYKKIESKCKLIKKCLCGIFIDKLEKIKQILKYTLNYLYFLKQKNSELYHYLTTLRKEKVLQILGYFDSYYSFQCSESSFGNYIPIYEILNKFPSIQEKQQRKRQYFNEFMDQLYQKSLQQEQIRNELQKQEEMDKQNLVIQNKKFIINQEQQDQQIKNLQEKIEKYENIILKDKQFQLQSFYAEQVRKKILEQNRIQLIQQKELQKDNQKI